MREPTDAERWVIGYGELVAGLKDGYRFSVYDYTNDISIRQMIEDKAIYPRFR